MEIGRAAYIVSAVRTPVGNADKGSFRNMRPEELGAIAVREALDRLPGLDRSRIDDVVMGCAFPEGPQGMNIGRVIAQRAGLPDEIPGATVNRFCSSGLQSIAMAAQSIMSGFADVVVAGGTECMSQVPMTGFFFSPDPELVASDPDVYVSMGITAENVAEAYGVSREDQDAFAYESHRRAIAAIDSGILGEEVAPVTVRDTVYRDGRVEPVSFVVDTDEGPRRDTSMEVLAKLPPAFRKNGCVTAGNASRRSDGAAALVLMDEATMRETGATPLGRLISFALHGVSPEHMGIGPIEAIRKALRKAGLTVDDLGLAELNEAFAAQALAVIREVGLNPETVNVNGGAIALGHPLGATGAKLSASLLYEMKRRGVRYGLCSMCVGGGMGAAGIFESLN